MDLKQKVLPLMRKSRRRARPRIKSPDTPVNGHGTLTPIDAGVITGKFGRVSGERVILCTRFDFSTLDQIKSAGEQGRGLLGETIVKFSTGLMTTETKTLLYEDRSSIKPLVHLHDGDTTFRIASQDGRLNGRSSAMEREK